MLPCMKQLMKSNGFFLLLPGNYWLCSTTDSMEVSGTSDPGSIPGGATIAELNDFAFVDN
jgi:hypothetical protein